jgi:adenylate cyclase
VPLGAGGNLAVLLAVCTALGAVGGAWSRRGVFIGAALLVALTLVLAGYLLFARGTAIDLFTPLVGIVLTYAGVVAFRLMTEGRRNRWLESTFGQYLSPAVIEELKKDPTRLELGGRRMEVTVLFSDIKGFTSISEQLKDRPGELVRLMNVYLTGQSEPVLVEDGVIDKFIGDAVMAFFGDPLAFGDHALRACRAALRSQDALEPVQPLASSLGLPRLSNRIGLNTGTAFLGNMGSDKRFSYTAMGDTVNLASRLEGANKAFGTHVLLGPATYEQAKDAILAKPIGRLRVVGKNEPVLVHELVALRDEASPEAVRHVDAYRRAHAAVLADDLDGALAALAEAESTHPGDGACAWLRGHVAALRRGDVARPWDGVVVLESKG